MVLTVYFSLFCEREMFPVFFFFFFFVINFAFTTCVMQSYRGFW